MFVRRTKSRQTDGASYHTHRLVRSERDGGRVRQRTLLNLGRHFDIDRERWPPLCQPRPSRRPRRPNGAADHPGTSSRTPMPDVEPHPRNWGILLRHFWGLFNRH